MCQPTCPRREMERQIALWLSNVAVLWRLFWPAEAHGDALSVRAHRQTVKFRISAFQFSISKMLASSRLFKRKIAIRREHPENQSNKLRKEFHRKFSVQKLSVRKLSIEKNPLLQTFPTKHTTVSTTSKKFSSKNFMFYRCCNSLFFDFLLNSLRRSMWSSLLARSIVPSNSNVPSDSVAILRAWRCLQSNGGSPPLSIHRMCLTVKPVNRSLTETPSVNQNLVRRCYCRCIKRFAATAHRNLPRAYPVGSVNRTLGEV